MDFEVQAYSTQEGRMVSIAVNERQFSRLARNGFVDEFYAESYEDGDPPCIAYTGATMEMIWGELH